MIVERIKQKCKEQKTSMNALEKELGFGNGTIRMWDIKEPGANKVILVAERLGLSLDWLLTGKESADLTPEEQKLVDTYRNCNPVGRQLIQEQVESIREKLPADNIEQPAGVSTSAVG